MYENQNHQYDPGGSPVIIGWFDDFDSPHSYRALSNFYEGGPLYIHDLDTRPFKTGEHAYAAMKARYLTDYERIREATTPGNAKKLGRLCELRPDWEEVKYDAMMAVLRAKFTLDREEGDVLMQTGHALLIEGTYWNDTVWGVSHEKTDVVWEAPGRNWLGTMLMARRAELQAEDRFGVQHSTGRHNVKFLLEQQVRPHPNDI